MSRAANGRGPGTSPEAILLRGMRANYRANSEALTHTDVCPECGKRRRTPETLRVHRWIAHNVKATS